MVILCSSLTLPQPWLSVCLVPEEVAAEDEAEHDDEEANAQDDDVEVERQVEELLGRHLAVEFGVLQSKVTQTPWEERHTGKVKLDDFMRKK